MGRGWQTKLLLDYGWSDATNIIPQINTAAEQAALRGAGLTNATALNPYNVSATNSAVLAKITNFWNYSTNTQRLLIGRAIADGPILSLPGGEVRVAVGAEARRMSVHGLTVVGVPGSTAGAASDAKARQVEALFGEIEIPIVGPDNAVPLVQALNLDMSGRYDHYQGVGSTTNPKIGLSWTVIDGLKIRSNWGTSFVAPGIQDTLPGGIDSTVMVTATSANLKPGDPVSDRNLPNLALTGGSTGVKPVTAQTWSAGFDYSPSQIEGLTLSMTYWKVDMHNLIQAGCAATISDQLAQPSLYGIWLFYMPSLQQTLDLIAPYQIIQGSSTNIPALYAAGTPVYYIQDRRRRNYGAFSSDGIDFRVAYRRPLEWGDLYASVAGTNYLSRLQQFYRGSAYNDLLAANSPPLQFQATLGADVGRFTATATFQYTDGFRITGLNNQTKLDSYTPVNLFFQYNWGDTLRLTLNIDNVANTMPPVANQSGGLFNNGTTFAESTTGRYVSFGVARKF